jgi:hypothetical protein
MSIPVYKNESAWRTFVLLHLSGIHNEIRRLEMTIVGARPPVRPGLSPQKIIGRASSHLGDDATGRHRVFTGAASWPVARCGPNRAGPYARGGDDGRPCGRIGPERRAGLAPPATAAWLVNRV